MLYLDNSATTYPKPVSVRNAINRALITCGANPGRSGHNMSMTSANEIYQCREALGKLLNAQDTENIVIVRNCTEAINVVLKGTLKAGDHVVVSCLEHNAIMRPLEKLKSMGISYTKAYIHEGNKEATINEFRNAIKDNTKLIACMHASNVWGIRLPIEDIAKLAHSKGIKIMVDAAQSAGVLPIDFDGDKLDYLCISGHKGLYGPMGTGILVVRQGEELNTLIEGGTGSDSISLEQPLSMPDRFESGTPNTAGIAGLRAGAEFVMQTGIENIHIKEMKLIQRIYDGLSTIPRVKLYTKRPNAKQYVPVLSFNIDGMQSERVAYMLNENNIALRAGLHCAPLAHEYFDTLSCGAARISPSIFTKPHDMDKLLDVVKKISKSL